MAQVCIQGDTVSDSDSSTAPPKKEKRAEEPPVKNVKPKDATPKNAAKEAGKN